ncbi:MAG: helicase-related protein, partial [Nitrososphaera sp.]
MPWRPQSSAIFGFVSRYCPRHGYLTPADGKHNSSHSDRGGRIVVNTIDNLPGPDLVIQDELHLIAGPLGTMVGLYEAAVEHLSSRKVGSTFYGPKVMVSTATVKGVEYQVKKLFNRNSTETFPPPGISAKDSFFWWEVEEGGRKFVGISGPSYSMKTSNLRLYASLLQKALEMKRQGIGNIDPYWTLVGYFNSRRELGGSLRLLEDDVVRRIDSIVDLIDDHKGFEKRIMSKNKELTGRIDSTEIPIILSDLENTDTSDEAIDVLLATNMISVGVDVDRLGLMVVTGQPKNTAEYIQAVGRVGRKPTAPGLIVTLY